MRLDTQELFVKPHLNCSVWTESQETTRTHTDKDQNKQQPQIEQRRHLL